MDQSIGGASERAVVGDEKIGLYPQDEAEAEEQRNEHAKQSLWQHEADREQGSCDSGARQE